MENQLSVLIIDDERHFTEELEEFFITCGFAAYSANSGEEGLAMLERRQSDLLILDVRLPGVNGLEILKFVKENHPSVEVIVVSAHGDMDTVISALRLGAIDYLRKPFRQLDIRIAIERTQKFLLLQQRLRLAEERSSLISNALAEKIERHMIGKSSGIRHVMELALTAAGFQDTNVLITGESGTGKENVARIIHFASLRKEQLLYTVNSSSVSESLMESEFFGYKKGAFTGASADKKGFFEICHGGTLFLDEIADMPLSLQAKVLRAIEEKRITRVGDTESIHTDFRLISATNHDLESMVMERKFRLDLLHRLNTLHIHIPPLRERTVDIEPLMLHFAEDFSRKINKAQPVIKPDVFTALSIYDFPGNVRELKNMVERAVILTRTGVLDLPDFPFRQRTAEEHGPASIQGTLTENEARLIRDALQRNGYNQQATAKELGISRDALIRKMSKYNIVLRRTES
jgi:DNA-binding NtrC family response regulator